MHEKLDEHCFTFATIPGIWLTHGRQFYCLLLQSSTLVTFKMLVILGLVVWIKTPPTGKIMSVISGLRVCLHGVSLFLRYKFTRLLNYSDYYY